MIASALAPVLLSEIYGGPGYLAGELSGDPEIDDGIVTVNDVPSARQIEVRDRITRRVVVVGFSKPDGTYRFDGLNPNVEFDLIARDWSGVYEDVIVGGVRPQPYA